MEFKRLVFVSFVYNPISLIFLSYLFGVLVTGTLKKSGHINLFNNWNFLNDVQTHQLGVIKFLWIIKHSFLGKINRELTFTGKAEEVKLGELIKKMTYSEVGHLFGFFILLLVNFTFLFWNVQLLYSLMFFFLNVIFNFYLVLIQQYNKRRIRRILANL